MSLLEGIDEWSGGTQQDPMGEVLCSCSAAAESRSHLAEEGKRLLFYWKRCERGGEFHGTALMNLLPLKVRKRVRAAGQFPFY